jgi:hypothetical protein
LQIVPTRGEWRRRKEEVNVKYVLGLLLGIHTPKLEGQSSLGFDEPGTPHPARRLASAMDLETWLLSLDTEDRLVLALRQAGSTLEEIGTACGKSINWARHRLLRLGYELAERAGVELEVAA